MKISCPNTLVLLFGFSQMILLSAISAHGQSEFYKEPINYSSNDLNDPISELQKKIDSGEIKLKYDSEKGYLPAVLKALAISTTSQSLVFSKTSFQQRRISPRTPRAIYFNDDAYIGWVPHGDVIEVTSVDTQKGSVFYTLAQEEEERPKFVRDQGNCMTCHASSRTFGIPGNLVRSVYPSHSGMPHFGSGTFRTNHESPLNERWGGWYVTGNHGKQRHMGNVIAKDRNHPKLDTEAGANVSDLDKFFSTKRYLSGHSDIVALMVLEHQSDMHNLITFANYKTRQAIHSGNVMNKALERPEDFVSESTERRIANAAEKLVKYMLFVDEAKLTDPIKGSTSFAKEFSSRGKKDSKGRSLRDFDLKKRMFKYPCSYLIYSKAFQALPKQSLKVVYRRLWEILTHKDSDKAFAHLSKADRKAIYEILVETVPNLPEYWK